MTHFESLTLVGINTLFASAYITQKEVTLEDRNLVLAKQKLFGIIQRI